MPVSAAPITVFFYETYRHRKEVWCLCSLTSLGFKRSLVGKIDFFFYILNISSLKSKLLMWFGMYLSTALLPGSTKMLCLQMPA